MSSLDENITSANGTSIMHTIIAVKPKSKRGRKPKAKTLKETQVNCENVITSKTTSVSSISNENEINTCVITDKKPKKRGRKPKGGKIIENNKEQNNKICMPNIILHLKCFMKDLSNNPNTFLLDTETKNNVHNLNTDDSINERSVITHGKLMTTENKNTIAHSWVKIHGIQSNKSLDNSFMNSSDIDCEHNNWTDNFHSQHNKVNYVQKSFFVYNSCNDTDNTQHLQNDFSNTTQDICKNDNKTTNTITQLTDTLDKSSNCVLCKQNTDISMKMHKNQNMDINMKLNLLENDLHINTIQDNKSACFWCTYDFDNPTIYIPKFYLKNMYHVYGCFCSPECAVSYLLNEHIDTSIKFERYYLLNYLYCKIYNYLNNIKPAPNPHYMLNKFCGNMTIQEYRSLLKNERLFLILEKPITRILPELHEDNNNCILNNKIIPCNDKHKNRCKNIISIT